MKCRDIIKEAKVAERIARDPRLSRLVAVAFKMDHTVPTNVRVQLGPRPTEPDMIKKVGEHIDRSLANSEYGDLSREGKFDEWLLRLYTDGTITWEDINGQAADALGKWKALSTRRALDPKHQDLNKISNLAVLERLMSLPPYSELLKGIRDQLQIDKMKKDRKEIELINDDRFKVSVLLNYGACWVFNREEGINPNFCTGSSSGNTYAPMYAKQGPIIGVLDKKNPNDVNGKWEIHAPTNQIRNALQQMAESTDENFAKLFPGLLKRITTAMIRKKDEIEKESSEILGKPYNVSNEVKELATRFPQSFKSGSYATTPTKMVNP